MEPDFSIDGVRRLAWLARLDPSPEALAEAARRLGAMVAYINRLQAMNLNAVEPLTHVGDEIDRLDDDSLGPTLDAHVLAQLSPAMDGPFIRVPKVIDPGPGA